MNENKNIYIHEGSWFVVLSFNSIQPFGLESSIHGWGGFSPYSRRLGTAGRYPASRHYQATKARRQVSMATCLDSESVGAYSRAKHRQNVNNQGFGLCFRYS